MRIMVAAILNKLRSTSSIIEKKKILIDNTDNELFKNVIKLAYSPLIRFNVTSSVLSDVVGNNTLYLEQLVDGLVVINKNNIRGRSLIDSINTLLSKGSSANNDILKAIIDKDLKIGVGVRVFNKVYGKNFIKAAPYMGAITYSTDKVKKLFSMGDVCSQVKMDGRYTNIIISDGVVLESRQGLLTYFGKRFDDLSKLQEIAGEAIVLNGELMLKGYEYNRMIANGIITSMVSILNKELAGEAVAELKEKFSSVHEDFNKMLESLYVVVWDYIPYSVYLNDNSWNTPYGARYAKLVELVKHAPDNISIVETVFVKNLKAAMLHLKDVQRAGLEGTILKSMEGYWYNKKPVTQIKLKKKIQIDLKITSFNYGAPGTKNENVISSINAVSSCGKIVTSPGGMSEATMSKVTKDMFKLKGTIVTVECNGITPGDKVYSTLHPRVIEFRDDKTIADSLEDCIAIEEASNSI